MATKLLVFVLSILGQAIPEKNAIGSDDSPLKLEHRGTIRLESNQPKDDQWLVLDFDIDHQGRIGFIEAGKQGRVRFLLLNENGSIAVELPLDFRDAIEVIFAKLRWVEDGDWLVLGTSHKNRDLNARAWHLDTTARRVQKLDPFDCPPTESVSSDRNGGFLIYSILPTPVQGQPQVLQGAEIIAFDLKGKRKWRTELPLVHRENIFMDHSGFPPFHGDIAATSDGQIALLNANTEDLHVLSDKGEYRRTIYSGYFGSCMGGMGVFVAPDLNGGVIISAPYSSGFRRLSLREGDTTAASQPSTTGHADETSLESVMSGVVSPKGILPMYPDGRTFHARSSTRAAPDGHLWATDSQRLLRLTSDGLVDRVIGEPLDDLTVPRDGRSFIDQQGRTYIMNERTGTVHVFDATGKKLHICQSKADDFKGSHGFYFTVRPDGGVYVWKLGIQCLSFSPKGDRLGFVDLGPYVRRARTMLFQPNSTGAWLLADNGCQRIDSNGNQLLALAKKSDGEDLRVARDAAVALDGSVAILDQFYGQKNTDETMSTFSSDGKPLQVKIVKERQNWSGQMAFDGRRVVSIAVKDKSLIMYDMNAGTVRPLNLGLKEEGWRSTVPFFSMQGRELWLLSVQNLTITRYKFADE